ncbi:MAG: M28 family metallopeptidase [Candidatus Thorarchaeota archaeon]
MIDEKRISKNVETFSFPRLSGTEFEKKSCSLAKQKIEELNLIPHIQKFTFSVFYSRVFPKLVLLLLSWFLLVLFLRFNFLFIFINSSLILLLLILLLAYTRNPEKIKLGETYHSHNLFVKVPMRRNEIHSQEDTSNVFFRHERNILLFSHLDSKGQSISIKIRVLSYKIWIDSFAVGILIIVLNATFFNNTIILHLFVGVIIFFNFVASGFIVLNTTNNYSKGAIDDASGISCIMELLHYYSDQENRPENFNLWFVFTGAEESGTMGIRNFYRNYIRDLDRKNTFIINFDSIANHAILYDHGLINQNNFKSNQYIFDNSEHLSLKGAKKFYIGMYSDGLFLYNKKFNGLGIGDKSVYKYVHSTGDEIDKINIALLKKLCELITILLKDIDY